MVRTLLLFLSLSLASVATAALTPDELDRVTVWLATPVDERPAIDTLDLPEQLTKADAKKITNQLWMLFEERESSSPLGPLPKSVTESIRDGRLELKAGLMPLGEHNMPFAVVRREEKKSLRLENLCFSACMGVASTPRPTVRTPGPLTPAK